MAEESITEVVVKKLDRGDKSCIALDFEYLAKQKPPKIETTSEVNQI